MWYPSSLPYFWLDFSVNLPTCISHVRESIWSWEWILLADLPGKESGQKSLCGSGSQAAWVETLVAHMASMCSSNAIEYCEESCCKFVYVRLDTAVNQCIRCSLTNLQTRLEFQQPKGSQMESDLKYIHKCRSNHVWHKMPRVLSASILLTLCMEKPLISWSLCVHISIWDWPDARY